MPGKKIQRIPGDGIGLQAIQLGVINVILEKKATTTALQLFLYPLDTLQRASNKRGINPILDNLLFLPALAFL